jgi:hypothetical protein
MRWEEVCACGARRESFERDGLLGVGEWFGGDGELVISRDADRRHYK